jgi:hypothetical protein
MDKGKNDTVQKGLRRVKEAEQLLLDLERCPETEQRMSEGSQRGSYMSTFPTTSQSRCRYCRIEAMNVRDFASTICIARLYSNPSRIGINY